MVSYSWSLSAGQSFDKQALFELQTSLVALGVYLDLSWDGNSPQLSISAPEVTSHTEVPTKAATEQNPSVPRESGSDSPGTAKNKKRRGRPASPSNDITLGYVHHMRFMGVPAEDIAREIGISRRTYFRVLQQIQHKNLGPDTPFSEWR
jgi:hypothetical protein